MLKRFFRWFFDLDNTRNSTVMKKSITGKSLVVFEDSSYGNGWRIRNTPEGMQGGVLINCFELHFDVEKAIEILSGKYDDCLTKECKDRAIRKVVKVLEKGSYGVYEHLDPYDVAMQIVEYKLTDSEKAELISLLK